MILRAVRREQIPLPAALLAKPRPVLKVSPTPGITTLGDNDHNIVKFAAAAKAGAGRSHQPRLDRPQRLFPRRTRSFFWRVREP